MSRKLSRLLLEQFKARRDGYVALLGEREQAKAELARISIRLGLLQELLALDGRNVEIPVFVQRG